jgi:hypothetical protein
MPYLFPYSTCEPVVEGSQPVSAGVNVLTTLALIGCLGYATTAPVQAVILSYAVISAVHTWSHWQHVPDHLQQRIIHVCFLVSAALTFWMLQSLTGHPVVPVYFWIVLAGLVVADGTAFYNRWYGDFAAILTGLSIVMWVVLGRWTIYPEPVKRMLMWLAAGVTVAVAMLFNEYYNCERMMETAPWPYHAGIEVMGMVLFVGAAGTWLLLEADET